MIKHFFVKMFYPFPDSRLVSPTKRSKSLSAGANNRTTDLSLEALSSFAGLSRFVQPQGMDSIKPLFNRSSTHGVC